jgi:hypothetical protein
LKWQIPPKSSPRLQPEALTLSNSQALKMSSTIDQITALISELSFSEKLTINEQLASSIRKEGKGVKGKKVKGDAKADKPKRKAALGTLAWTAYVKHIKTTQPDAFEGITKESEKLVIVKGIRADDPDGYKTFTDEWKASREADASDDASVAESVAEDASVAETASVAEAEAEEEPVPAPAPKKVVKAAAPAPKKEAPAAAPKAAKTVKKAKASE